MKRNSAHLYIAAGVACNCLCSWPWIVQAPWLNRSGHSIRMGRLAKSISGCLATSHYNLYCMVGYWLMATDVSHLSLGLGALYTIASSLASHRNHKWTRGEWAPSLYWSCSCLYFMCIQVCCSFILQKEITLQDCDGVWVVNVGYREQQTWGFIYYCVVIVSI